MQNGGRASKSKVIGNNANKANRCHRGIRNGIEITGGKIGWCIFAICNRAMMETQHTNLLRCFRYGYQSRGSYGRSVIAGIVNYLVDFYIIQKFIRVDIQSRKLNEKFQLLCCSGIDKLGADEKMFTSRPWIIIAATSTSKEKNQ